MKRLLKWIALMAIAALATGCASHQPYDYAAFKAARPRSILVLPPLNESKDVKATYGMLSQVSVPLAESGYYVLPVALVDETFKQNGLTTAGDIHAVPLDKLQKIFGADAALYVTVTKYGNSYQLIDSVATVEAKARLVELKTGKVLWTGSAVASNANNDSNGGLLVMLVQAAIKQVVNELSDASYPVAGMTSNFLLSAGRQDGLLYGPYHPMYATQ